MLPSLQAAPGPSPAVKAEAIPPLQLGQPVSPTTPPIAATSVCHQAAMAQPVAGTGPVADAFRAFALLVWAACQD